MIRELIPYLKLMHGVFNASVLILFVYQGMLGLKIRTSGSRPFDTIKRHRKIGPFAAALGISGFIAGMTLVLLDAGRILKYPLHFLTGLLIVILILTTWIISGKIKGPDPALRNRHFAIGVMIIVIYCIQAVLGLGILL